MRFCSSKINKISATGTGRRGVGQWQRLDHEGPFIDCGEEVGFFFSPNRSGEPLEDFKDGCDRWVFALLEGQSGYHMREARVEP